MRDDDVSFHSRFHFRFRFCFRFRLFYTLQSTNLIFQNHFGIRQWFEVEKQKQMHLWGPHFVLKRKH